MVFSLTNKPGEISWVQNQAVISCPFSASADLAPRAPAAVLKVWVTHLDPNTWTNQDK
jgi:hypothetical protein